MEEKRKVVGLSFLLLLFEKWRLNPAILMSEQEEDIIAFCQEYGGEEGLTEYIRILREEGLLELIPGYPKDTFDWHHYILSERGRKKIDETLSFLFKDIIRRDRNDERTEGIDDPRALGDDWGVVWERLNEAQGKLPVNCQYREVTDHPVEIVIWTLRNRTPPSIEIFCQQCHIKNRCSHYKKN
jgi:hypothetical protein